MKEKSTIRTIILSGLFLAFLVGITLVCMPYISQLAEPDFQAEFQKWVTDMGFAGLLFVFGIQVLQIVIAFIPGEPVELAAGVLYGAIGGTLICLLGCMLASSIIFTLSKRFGKCLLHRLFSEEKMNGWRWLQDSKKVDTATFLLFFIPGTPKDMLTYVIGITEMKLGKFLVLSTIARIPSILSSAIIGSAMRQGDWKTVVLIFIPIGLAGITGILCKDRLIGLCRRITKRDKAFTKNQCLDFAATAHYDKLYPLITCQIEYTGVIDMPRLVEAVRLSAITVPEILYAYDYSRGRFVDTGCTATDVVQAGTSRFSEGWKWDFTKDTQLKLLVCDNKLIAGISHILCDDIGFLQYLYLLSSLYNGAKPDSNLCNHRDISPILKGIKPSRPTPRERQGGKYPVLSLKTDGGTDAYFRLSAKINKTNLTAIHKKAKRGGASLNDAFLTAYARVLARMLHTEKILLPCPANLRRFAPIETLTAANMTGMYKIAVEIKPHHSFDTTLSQVRTETQLQKERRRCFSFIRPLHLIHSKLPPPLTNWIVRKNYTVLPLSYTNIGVIDSHKLAFEGMEITDCFLTGTYRPPPDFQLCVSTFQNTCTLNCTLLGTSERKAQGQQILDCVKRELQTWTAD